MKASDFSGELESDYLLLQKKTELLLEVYVKIGEQKAREEFFKVFRDLLTEKDFSGDTIAVDVLNWVYEELSERLAVE